MVGKEKEVVREARSAARIAREKIESTKRRVPSRGRDKSPSGSKSAASGDRLRERPRKVSDASPSKPEKPKSDAKKPPKTPKKATPKTPRKAAPASPARTATLARRTLSTRKPEVKRTQVINIVDSDSDSDTTATSGVQPRSKRTMSRESSAELMTLRPRLHRENATSFKSMNSVCEPISRRRPNEFSDEDLDNLMDQSPTPKVGRFAGLATIFATLAYCLCEFVLTYLIPVLCNEQHCGFRYPQRKDVQQIVASFDPAVFFSFTAFFLFNGILSIVPIGGRKYSSLATRDIGFDYVLNGLFAMVVQVAILIASEVYHIPVTAHIINNVFSLLTSAVVLAFVLGLVLLVKSMFTRRDKLVDANQGVLSSFILGGELNPRFGPMDVKFVLVRICLIGEILLVLSYVYQSMEMIEMPPPTTIEGTLATGWFTLIQSVRIRPTLCVLSTLTFIYFIDQLIFESGLMSYMEFKSVSWGFLKCNEYMAGIFVYGAAHKYVYDYKVELESWELALCTLVFLIGYGLYRGANSQKHAFRENPYSILISKYESIPTTTGKKILCSGYWGFVRHPNYLGDMLLNAALVRFVWPTPLLLVFLFIGSHLMLRAYVDNKKCSQRYGVAWNRYCQRVPYLLVPKVF